MDVRFQPQQIELTIYLTPAEAKQILIDLPPTLLTNKTLLGKLTKAIQHISRMISDELLEEIQSDYSLDPGRLPPGVRPGQRGDSRP